MIDAAVVVAEQRPMLEEFLEDVGLHRAGAPLDLRAVLPGLDRWLEAQDVAEEDVAFLAAQLGAYMCLYLVDHCGAKQVIVENKIVVQVPVVAGVIRELEPYQLAWTYAKRKPIGFLAIVQALAT
jgi:hypothetical protein